jgi:hypothetical protein
MRRMGWEKGGGCPGRESGRGAGVHCGCPRVDQGARRPAHTAACEPARPQSPRRPHRAAPDPGPEPRPDQRTPPPLRWARAARMVLALTHAARTVHCTTHARCRPAPQRGRPRGGPTGPARAASRVGCREGDDVLREVAAGGQGRDGDEGEGGAIRASAPPNRPDSAGQVGLLAAAHDAGAPPEAPRESESGSTIQSDLGSTIHSTGGSPSAW